VWRFSLGFRRIYLLDYGWLAGDGEWFLPGWGAATYSEREPKRVWVEFPVFGALLDTDVGYILFDTGVRVLLGLILFDIKPFSLGFKALRIPFSPGSISLGSSRSG
jgi:hypothetical protein